MEDNQDNKILIVSIIKRFSPEYEIMRFMKIQYCHLVALYLFISVSSAFAQDYTVPRNEHGHPDLQGVWNFSTQTPFQRPEQYGDREFLTREEIIAINERRVESQRASDEREANVAQRLQKYD